MGARVGATAPAMSSLPHTEPATAAAEPVAADWRAGLLLAWFGLALPLVAISVASFAMSKSRSLADLFFFEQDFSVVILMGALLMALRFAPPRLLAVVPALSAKPVQALAFIAAGSAVVAAAGWFVVCHAYPLSMDEFMAGFDAEIFRHGRPLAEIPQVWRAYDVPLQPQFVLHVPGGAAWVSLYLPVNAALRAVLGLVGAAWASGAVYAVVTLVTVFALARRFWPERPDAAVVAVGLVATSPQFLVTAMTPYAMSAHLAFNLVWLWLFLRPDWKSQSGAIVVAALASGLHQVVFHPLFAAPFVLDLWLSRRWARAALHTGAYAVIVLFWILYWKLVDPAGGVGVAGGSSLGVELFVRRIQALLVNFNLAGIGFMAKNLVRFIAWQNPLLPALALVGIAAAIHLDGTFRALLAGMALTLLVCWVLLPFQGHGWGYRYLHGFLGSLALVAALGWVRLTEALAEPDRRAARAMLVLGCAVSVLVLLPLRALQVEAMIRPYAAATRAIDRTPAEVVLIDPTGLFYAADLVRNDPFLRNRPKRMDLGTMTDAQVRGVCALHPVALFDRREGLALGVESNPGGPTRRMQAIRGLLASLGCGERLVPTS